MKQLIKNILKALPDSVQKYLREKFDYIQNAPACFICNILECFVDGQPTYSKAAANFYQTEAQSVEGRWDSDSDEDKGLRYKHSMELIKPTNKVLDCGCGSARLQGVLECYVGDVNYLGLEVDENYLQIANKYDRNVRKCNLNNLKEFEAILKEFKPDVVYMMYFFYFLDEPEKFIEIAARHSKLIILGGRNHAMWFHRLRYLFGKSVVTGSPLFHAYSHISRSKKVSFISRLNEAVKNWPRDVNDAYPRSWGYKDYVMLFKDLGYKHKYLCSRGHCIGRHYKFLPFKKLRAFSFQFAVYPEK